MRTHAWRMDGAMDDRQQGLRSLLSALFADNRGEAGSRTGVPQGQYSIPLFRPGYAPLDAGASHLAALMYAQAQQQQLSALGAYLEDRSQEGRAAGSLPPALFTAGRGAFGAFSPPAGLTGGPSRAGTSSTAHLGMTSTSQSEGGSEGHTIIQPVPIRLSVTMEPASKARPLPSAWRLISPPDAPGCAMRCGAEAALAAWRTASREGAHEACGPSPPASALGEGAFQVRAGGSQGHAHSRGAQIVPLGSSLSRAYSSQHPTREAALLIAGVPARCGGRTGD